MVHLIGAQQSPEPSGCSCSECTSLFCSTSQQQGRKIALRALSNGVFKTLLKLPFASVQKFMVCKANKAGSCLGATWSLLWEPCEQGKPFVHRKGLAGLCLPVLPPGTCTIFGRETRTQSRRKAWLGRQSTAKPALCMLLFMVTILVSTDALPLPSSRHPTGDGALNHGFQHDWEHQSSRLNQVLRNRG